MAKNAGTAAAVLFAYDEGGRLIGEYDASGVPIQETVWLGNTPVATIRPVPAGWEAFYVWADHLDTPRAVSDASNQLRWSWAHGDPFGAHAPDENPAGVGAFSNNLRFPGQYFDAEAGTNYNYFRDYDPSIGRYVESDPIGLEGGLNTFAYVRGKPTTYTDPLGLDWFKPPNAPSSVGREGSIVEPGGPVSSIVENWVPAGYEFGILHDHFVGEAVARGWPDVVVNIPSMPYFYWRAVATETYSSIGDAISKFKKPKSPQCP